MSAAERLVALFVTPVVEPRAAAQTSAQHPASAERSPVLGGGASAPTAGPPSLIERPEHLAVRRLPSSPGDGTPGSPRRGRRKPRPVRSGADTPNRVAAADEPESGTYSLPGRDRRAECPATPPLELITSIVPAAAEPFDFASELIACGLRVCVLGGGQAGASLAWALAARLARLPATRCATLCSAAADAGPVPARPPGPPAPARSTARRLARCLVADGHHAAVRGRVVQALLPDSPEVTRELFAAIDARAPGTPTLTVLPGVRHPGFDALVAGQDLILVVVAAGAPPSLCALAVAELAALAPHATVQAVPLPARHSAGARRAAVGRALKALR